MHAILKISADRAPVRFRLAQNREREAAVPEKVLDGMIEKWEPPTTLEAHDVVWIGPDFRPVPELEAASREPTREHIDVSPR